MTNQRSTASVVIPVYNGQDTIIPLVDRLEKVLPELFESFEIILVDDGSPDKSWAAVQSLVQKYPTVRGIELMKNFGQHNATLCGIRAAKYEITITMDDDLQHPPEQIPLLLDTFQKGGYDVVYAMPKKLPHEWWRNAGSKLTKIVLGQIMGIPIREIGAFRLFKTSLRKAFDSYKSPEVYVDPLLAWGTNNFGHVYVEEDPRTVGHSNYSFRKLVRASILILTGYSTIPLRFASGLGFIFMLFGLGVLIYAIVIAVSVGSVPGFPFLASLISIFAGAQLATLGIMGEYLARIYDRTTDRPPYIVKEEEEHPNG